MENSRGTRIKSLWRRCDGRPRTRAVLLTGGLIAVLAAPLGVAATGDVLREGQRNGTAARETKIVARVNASSGSTGGYATRQSNLSSTGGGAIYGCRSGAGGSAANPPQEPCVRASNLSNGLAFEFAAREGETAGTIEVGSGGDAKRPFTTNATGVATGLNADRVDGRSADELTAAAVAAARPRWLLLDEKGKIEEQSGGFTVLDGYQADDNVYVDAGSSLEGKGLSATIALQNKIDQSGDGTADPSFTGLVAVARCQTASVECAPAGAKNVNAFVVAPRNLDGSGTTSATRKRVYVQVMP
jgi:hypothetical protein